MLYYRLIEGFNQKKAKFIPETNNIYEFITNQNRDWYLSTYLFSDTHYNQFKETSSVAGIRDVVSKRLWWDVDSKDLDVAKGTTLTIVKRLKKYGLDDNNIQIRFSGGKGFHVMVDLEDYLTPSQVENIAIEVSGDLPGFDRSLYDEQQILRVPLTKHNKTDYYCTPITVEELTQYSIEQLEQEASSITNIDPNTLNEYYKAVKLPKSLEKFKDIAPKAPKEVIKTNLEFNISDINFHIKPNFLDNARYALQQGYFRGSESASNTGDSGERSHALMCLAATYKNRGFDKELAYSLLKGVTRMQASRTGEDRFDNEELYNNIINQVFSERWGGGQYSVNDPRSWLYKYVKTYNIPIDEYDGDVEVIGIKDIMTNFFEYAKNIDQNTMRFGIPEIDEKYRAQVGHVVGILAAPGIGKTSLSLQILSNTSKDGVDSIFFSYDMAQKIMGQKLAQRETKMSTDPLFDKLKVNDETLEAEILSKGNESFENVKFVFKSGQSIKDIKKTIYEHELRLGRSVKLIVVDYLELVRSQFNDPTLSSAEIIQGFREIANEMDKCVIILLQPNKTGTSINEPLLNYTAAKGSSAIAQAVTTMITAHRPGYDPTAPQNDVYLGVNCVKNRMGPLFSADFKWEGMTGKLYTLSDREKGQLKMIREANEEEKQESDASYASRTSAPSYTNRNRRK